MQENDNENLDSAEIPPEPEGEELTHSDKLLGVIVSPIKTFTGIASMATKVTDWLIPLTVMIIFAIASTFLMMKTPQLRAEAIAMRLDAIEKSFQEQVKSGKLSKQDAETQYNKVAESMDSYFDQGLIIQFVSIVIFSFLLFFLISAIFYVIVKYFLKGQGDYKMSMAVYGLPQYIMVIQIIVMTASALLMQKLMMGTSVAAFAGVDKHSWSGFLLGKLDPFSIWFYWVVAVGYAKLFKSDNSSKYIITIFGLWIGFSLLLFILSKIFPFFENFIW